MKKETIKYLELLAKINQIIDSHPECKNIHIDGLTTYKEQVNGANWDITIHRQSGSAHDWLSCAESIRDDIQELREKFDVLK